MSFPSLCDGRFEIERVFADSGGMGILYLARDMRCAGNRVVVKATRYDSGPRGRNLRYTLDEAVAHIRRSRKILEWEKKVLVRFRNEGLNNVPSANHFFVDQSLTLERSYDGKFGTIVIPDELLATEPYLVMELLPGEILESRMAAPSFREKLEVHLLLIAREVLTIFIRLHRDVPVGQGTGQFLYQDLKPANLIVSGDDYITLIDFGGVTLRLGEKTTDPTAGCITMGYAAPEAANGREAFIDERFDVYTLGATLWHAATLVDPRELGDFPVLDPAKLVGVGLGDETVRIIRRALARDPAQRYESAAAMRRDVMERLRTLSSP